MVMVRCIVRLHAIEGILDALHVGELPGAVGRGSPRAHPAQRTAEIARRSLPIVPIAEGYDRLEANPGSCGLD